MKIIDFIRTLFCRNEDEGSEVVNHDVVLVNEGDVVVEVTTNDSEVWQQQ